MRISDWSSDVCSSDLAEARLLAAACRFPPVGQRSMIARIPQTGFVRSPVNEFVKAENQKRSEEHTSELQSLMRISYAVFCLKKKKRIKRVSNLTLMEHDLNHI